MGLFARVQTPRYVADNVGASVECSSFLPLLRLSGEKEARALCFEPMRTVVGSIRVGQAPRKGRQEEVRGSAPPETVDLVNGSELNSIGAQLHSRSTSSRSISIHPPPYIRSQNTSMYASSISPQRPSQARCPIQTVGATSASF